MENDRKLASIRREVFTYFSGLPKTLQDGNQEGLIASAMNLGNFLCWIAPLLDDGPPHDQPLSETAISVHALGKQFRQVGLKLWESKQQPALKTDLEQRFEMLWQMVKTNRELINRALAAVGLEARR